MSLLVVLIALALCTVAFMSLWFGLALYLHRIDVVDTAWGLGFCYVAILTCLMQPSHNLPQLIALSLVVIWGIRLSLHITLRNIHKEEDARYTAYRQKWGKHFFIKTYLNIYLLQGLLILVISLPVVATISSVRTELSLLGLLGIALWIFGIIFESIADNQLRRFLQKRAPGQIMQSGLWKYSRHPNYFGEISAWWGASLLAVSLNQWWGILGGLTITFLIVKVSGIPPLEKHYADNKAYQAYAQHTSKLIPFPKHS